jgi:ribosome-binding factor A
MATSRRVARVASLIKREVSQMLISGIKDDRVGAGMVSVTDVDVSGDLQHAKIFVSIYGTAEAKAETMAGLKAATAYVRSELGQRIRLRRTPEVIFREDLGWNGALRCCPSLTSSVPSGPKKKPALTKHRPPIPATAS